MNKSSFFDGKYFDSNVYEWKKIKFIVFSKLSSTCGTFQKRLKDDELFEPRDLDWIYLKKFIEDNYKKKSSVLFLTKLEQIKEDTSLGQYDCFFFVFLTFMTSGKGKVDKIHFHDKMVTVDEIWKEVSQIPEMYNKPKILLMQADDVSLLEKPYSYSKGPGRFSIEIRKIPTDADRLTITSTIPADGYVTKDMPSFLIQAFAEEVAENNTKDEAWDLWSLTTLVNKRMQHMINTSEGERIKDANKMKETHGLDMLQIPCTTSTLTKLLYL